MIDLMTRHTSLRVAEVGGLLIAIAGVWMFVSGLPFLKLAPFRLMVAGLLLAGGGVCLIVALHEGLVVLPKK